MPDLSAIQIFVLVAGCLLVFFGLGALVESARPHRARPIDVRLERLREYDLAHPESHRPPQTVANLARFSTDPLLAGEALLEHETELVEDLFAEIFSLRVSVAQLTTEINSLRDSIEQGQTASMLPVFLRRAA